MSCSTKDLLAHSYLFSAYRILQALDGAITVSNSREPLNPPIGSGRVVALCGQGGRHPYFEIPLDALIAAVAQILAQYPNVELDQIASICEELRRRTWFNTSTGCVNDYQPLVVPLLPPEDIWCDGRELPLDVWRLVSFDYDLVSSAILSEIPITDLSYGPTTQTALAFAHLMNKCGQETLKFKLTYESFPPAGPLLPPEIAVTKRQLFFEAGSLLTPLPTDEFSTWYPAVRYIRWLDETGDEFRVKKDFEADSIDTRYKGLFSEEMAIGMTAVVLREVFGAIVINNTSEIRALYGAKASGVIADFVVRAQDPSTGAPRIIVAESKGSLRQKVSQARLLHAKKQVTATQVSVAGLTPSSRLAFCSSIRYEGQKKATTCHIVDPDGEETDRQDSLDPIAMYRCAFSKTLRFVGNDTASRQVYAGEPATALPDPDVKRPPLDERDRRAWKANRRRGYVRQHFDAEVVRDLGEMGLALDVDVLRVLRRGLDHDSTHDLDHCLERARPEKRERRELPRGSFFNDLGIGVVQYVD